MIKCVTLDVWNTIARIDTIYSSLARRVANLKGEPVENVMSTILEVYAEAKEKRRRAVFNEPRVVEESCRLMAKRLGISVSKLKDLLVEVFMAIDTREVLFDDALAAIRGLRSLGVKLGIIGNTLFWPSALTRLILARAGISALVDEALFSDEVGVCKPDRRIFLEALSRLGVSASESIHVGDGLVEDVGGALSAGMYAGLIDRSSRDKIVVKEARLVIVHDLTQLLSVIKELA
ncbi:MAG: HAD family hydrolase [Crenarchaeota archaeon]|nr:HAD family hydrolase [Thermoproteota archaeon]